MHGTRDDPAGIRLLEQTAEAGFDYVELPLAQIMEFPQDEFEKLRAAVFAGKIRCLANNNFFPVTMRLTGPDVYKDAVYAYIEKALERSRLLGAKKAVFGSGPARHIPGRFPRGEGHRQLVGLLRDMASTAEKSGIDIVIEPLNRQESNIINSFEEGCALCDEVSRKNVKVLVDYYHLVKEAEPLEHIRQNGTPFLSHAHFAGDGAGRLYPATTGKDEYLRFFNALKAVGYDGAISLEAYNDNPAIYMKPALAMMRELWKAADGSWAAF